MDLCLWHLFEVGVRCSFPLQFFSFLLLPMYRDLPDLLLVPGDDHCIYRGAFAISADIECRDVQLISRAHLLCRHGLGSVGGVATEKECLRQYEQQGQAHANGQREARVPSFYSGLLLSLYDTRAAQCSGQPTQHSQK